ncbi:MAG TPA: FAD/NAD(P)-binding oxidoreductase [Rhodanobacteraceae bacterium]
MTRHYDVLVIGAGPAGLAAARAAATHGGRVGLVDMQPRAGGQVWRQDVEHAPPAAARRGFAATLTNPSIDWLAGTQIIAAESGGVLAEAPDTAHWLEYGALVLATGARELLLPFPGWTLPGVTGAGGLQALAKQGWPLAGKRVVVAGSGPLLLATAATALRHGARVLAIHEQAAPADVSAFARGLWRWPGKALQAAALMARLARVPYRRGSVVTAAFGDDHLREIECAGADGSQRVACDYLAVGYGLVPNARLAQTLGCRLVAEGTHARITVDASQRTSVANVYAAGEACGIGGRDCALAEGAIAGHAAAGAKAIPVRLLRQRDHARAFATHLLHHFALDRRVSNLARPDTIICRCEDVPLHALEGHADFRSAKLATRCGMGPCQGRICGTALAEMGRFTYTGARAPVFPARLGTLAEDASNGAVDAPDRAGGNAPAAHPA